MKKCLIALFLLFSTVALAKTWEANLRSCDGYGGFWFPNHNWTDKGEPWIKPFINGECPFMDGGCLEYYKETGISFNYVKASPIYTYYNPFEMWWTPNQSNKTNNPIDSVYFFVTNCGVDSTQSYVCDKYLSLENISMDDFYLVISKSYENDLDSRHEFNLDVFYNYMTGMYFIYKKYSDKFEYIALCNLIRFAVDYGYFYEIQCEFQDDGTLNFDKIPNAKAIPENFCSTQSIPSNRRYYFKQKNELANFPFYKVNGIPATKNSSNIVIQNKQPMLRLKGGY
ncbi:hypothetical protein [Fibrobacter sp.]|uniref:hypothetical protein n=1 Tax=Fibrobacter sp. TaxID=35828 RepID=UPI0025BFCCD2|nr:hypothetical protein [Fibrobacter sp.]MBR3070976.1 hypothetical protein [Fibrobacter sp.]